MVSLRTKTSVRVPSFSGPFALAAGLLTVICFSEPFWQNFYIIDAYALNTTMKAGIWGVCTRYVNDTGVSGPTTFCTSKTSGYTLNFVYNTTSTDLGNPNQFPLSTNSDTLFGLKTGFNGIRIISSGATSALWLHVISAVLTIVTVASLILPPSYLGSPHSRLFHLQKSGMATIFLALLALGTTVATFIVDMMVIIPAKNALNSIPGIHANIGNLPYFVLPSFILMIPALLSVLMTSSVNEFAAL